MKRNDKKRETTTQEIKFIIFISKLYALYKRFTFQNYHHERNKSQRRVSIRGEKKLDLHFNVCVHPEAA